MHSMVFCTYFGSVSFLSWGFFLLILESFVHFNVQEIFPFFWERTLQLFISAWKVMFFFRFKTICSEWHKRIFKLFRFGWMIPQIKLIKHVHHLTSNDGNYKMKWMNSFLGYSIEWTSAMIANLSLVNILLLANWRMKFSLWFKANQKLT